MSRVQTLADGLAQRQQTAEADSEAAGGELHVWLAHRRPPDLPQPTTRSAQPAGASLCRCVCPCICLTIVCCVLLCIFDELPVRLARWSTPSALLWLTADVSLPHCARCVPM